MHGYFVQKFVESKGNGLERMPTTDDLLRGRRLYVSGTRYSIGRVSLVSTQKAGAPFAYVTRWGDPSREQLQSYEHVELSDAEKDAVERLGKGDDVVRLIDAEHPEVIGAIRMQSNCAKCHQAKEGELLGAFRYPLEREEAGLTDQTAHRTQSPTA